MATVGLYFISAAVLFLFVFLLAAYLTWLIQEFTPIGFAIGVTVPLLFIGIILMVFGK